MSGTNVPAEEFRTQRHEFILHYYDMAVKDLERHLQVGWQSISFAAGVVALLTAGQQGYLPVPIVVSAALAISFWGIENVLDADLWSRRAIGFLANVEAVYFKYGDRAYFNPYAGEHPPAKILDSLKAQLVAALLFVALTVFYFAWSTYKHVENFLLAGNNLSMITRAQFAFWLIPFFFFLYLLLAAVKMRRDRLSDYLDFVRDCPGPGMIKAPEKWRGVDFAVDLQLDEMVAGDEIQRAVREDLIEKVKAWSRFLNATLVLSIVAGLGLVLLVIFQRQVLAYF